MIEFKVSKREKIILFPMVILILSYFILLPAYPNFLFRNILKYKNYNIHYNGLLNKQILLMEIQNADIKLKKSEFYNENISTNIYVCNDKFLYSFLNPLNYKGFASNHVKYRNIFLAQVDLKNHLAITLYDKTRTEPLSNLLAHEINHGLSKYKLGKTMNEWKEEGYAEYIAYDKKVNLKKEYLDTQNRNYSYIKRKSIVYYLLKVKKIQMSEFIKKKYDLDKLDIEIMLYLNK